MSKRHFLWVDTETIGLNEDNQGNKLYNPILEIGVILTDNQFNILDEYHAYIDLLSPQELQEIINKKENFYEMHITSGLVDNWLISKRKTISEVTDGVCNMIKDIEGKILLAGSSVSFDKEVLRRNLPCIYDKLYYQILDVSSIKQMMSAIDEDYVTKVIESKNYKHYALDDIKESIKELRMYMNYITQGETNEQHKRLWV